MPGIARLILTTSAAVGGTAASILLGSYQREIRKARAHVRAGARIAETDVGPIEYGTTGDGSPVLLIHGASGGYDQGLLLAEAFAPAGVRVIAPSRFGYLGTPLPADASPTAQARAHVALLDSLGIATTVVVGVSAGAPSALETALHHPKRVRGLIMVVPRGYTPNMPSLPFSRASLLALRLILSSDFAYWSAMRIAGDRFVRRMGVPPDRMAGLKAEERERASVMMKSVLPVRPRHPGLRNDLATRLVPLPLETIDTPTLVITSRDDLFDTLPAAQFTVEHMRNARLIEIDQGGHLFLGRRDEVKDAVAAFLEERATAVGNYAASSRSPQSKA